MKKKNFSWLWILLIVFLIGVVVYLFLVRGGIVNNYYSSSSSTTNNNAVVPSQSVLPSEPVVVNDSSDDDSGFFSWVKDLLPVGNGLFVPMLSSNGDSCNSDEKCMSGYCDLGVKAIGTCRDEPSARSVLPTVFNCRDYATSHDFVYTYNNVLPMGTECVGFAGTQCSFKSRGFEAQGVRGETCCMWNC